MKKVTGALGSIKISLDGWKSDPGILADVIDVEKSVDGFKFQFNQERLAKALVDAETAAIKEFLSGDLICQFNEHGLFIVQESCHDDTGALINFHEFILPESEAELQKIAQAIRSVAQLNPWWSDQ